jgi:uncharacterized protein YjiS (DUF1127 family)
MTCTTIDSPRRPAPPRLTLLERWHRRLQHRRATALAKHRLGQLDDHLLRDIGLDRADIDRWVRHGR